MAAGPCAARQHYGDLVTTSLVEGDSYRWLVMFPAVGFVAALSEIVAASPTGCW